MSEQKRRALLISGGINKTVNHPRYRNDLERWCLALQDRGFDCAVCAADGSGLAVKGARVLPATRSDINAELAQLANLASTDLVIVLVSNHGDAAGFCTWGTDRVAPSDLSQALSGCAATKVLIFGQCNSGVFGSMTISDAVVITACGTTEPSWACAPPPGADAYDEFLYQLAEVLFGPVGQALPAGNPPRAGAAGNPLLADAQSVPTPGLSVAPAANAPIDLQNAFDEAAVRDRRPETPTITDPSGLAKTLVLG